MRTVPFHLTLPVLGDDRRPTPSDPHLVIWPDVSKVSRLSVEQILKDMGHTSVAIIHKIEE